MKFICNLFANLFAIYFVLMKTGASQLDYSTCFQDHLFQCITARTLAKRLRISMSLYEIHDYHRIVLFAPTLRQPSGSAISRGGVNFYARDANVIFRW